MLKKVTLCCFSPTGGTKKAAEAFCCELAEEVQWMNLMEEETVSSALEGEVVVAAAPVYAGRVPAVEIERLKWFQGCGKKAVTIAVYGNRAYDDALLELNDTMEELGFQVIASAALVAKHSLVPNVAAERPDEEDFKEIREFAQKVSEKLAQERMEMPEVPGNKPYKEAGKMPTTPITLETCDKCGICAKVCPTKSISITAKVSTELEKCIFCAACIAHCPKQARILPPPVQEQLHGKLSPLEAVSNKNEFYL